MEKKQREVLLWQLQGLMFEAMMEFGRCYQLLLSDHKAEVGRIIHPLFELQYSLLSSLRSLAFVERDASTLSAVEERLNQNVQQLEDLSACLERLHKEYKKGCPPLQECVSVER